jgi:hypothetical protein
MSKETDEIKSNLEKLKKALNSGGHSEKLERIIKKKIKEEEEKLLKEENINPVGKKAVVKKAVKKPLVKKTPRKRTASLSPAKGVNIMTLAKENRVAGESWNDAIQKAKKFMSGVKTTKQTKIDNDLQAIKKLLKTDKTLAGFKKSDIIRDAKLTALPRGKRRSKAGAKNQHGESKGGNIYYENRDNHSDRLAPNYPKNKPLLVSGGDLQDLNISNSDLFEKGGKVDKTIANIIINQIGGISRLKAFTGADNFTALKNGVTFKIKNKSINFVEIKLNSMDTYDVLFAKVSGIKLINKKQFNDIYSDQLIELFEENTGMYLSFENGGDLSEIIIDSTQNYMNYYLNRGGRIKSAIVRDRRNFNSSQAWEKPINSKGVKRKIYKKDE